ncbi:hypothetical protein E2F50_15155 [Rhizobium deserti]|uniref:Uncharacterized protein n=1 Tax=Rhizobium deserti TaxID=2547961 RepID=A0A4R5UHW9_9HYPH|nr:hypothetical protein [Rhizobium deserti]TDK35565.1 hypothetical protein E2F50_15155 [Rhizobium deserti]
MQGLKIMIAGPSDFLPETVRQAWLSAGIELLGPFPVASIDRNQALHSNGVVIDISESPDGVFALSENLETWHVPFLYALPEGSYSARTGPYILNDVADDIQAIVNSLLSDYDIGVRH